MISSNKKYHSIQITRRFLQAMDDIVGRRGAERITAKEFGDTIGIHGSNLTRLRNSGGEHAVTIEAVGRICKEYNVSPAWLILGTGEMILEVKKKNDPFTDLKNAVKAVEDVYRKKTAKTNRQTKT